MRAIDANIVVRFLVRDDPGQATRAYALVTAERVFVPRTVMLETEWVLRALYAYKPHQIVKALRGFAGLPTVELEDPALVGKALDWFEAGLDFADALHLSSASHCEGFATFDKRFARSAARLQDIPMGQP